MRYSNDTIFSAVAVSETNAYNSEAIDASSMYSVSAQAVTAGSNPNGAMKLQFSNDTQSPSSWSDVTNATVSTTNNGVYAIQKADICAMWIRFVYTNASGSGTITAAFKANGY